MRIIQTTTMGRGTRIIEALLNVLGGIFLVLYVLISHVWHLFADVASGVRGHIVRFLSAVAFLALAGLMAQFLLQ
jgi:hypothetical protein